MNINDLKPASEFASKYGVKSIVYGKPGTGKTPMLNSAPRPVLLSVEPGLKSMANSSIPTFEAHTIDKLEEFFKWFFGSQEVNNFDTLAIDSASQIAEVSLLAKALKFKDGRQVYGEMGKQVGGWFNDLFFFPNKHIIAICKEGKEEIGTNMINEGGTIKVEVITRLRPYFPGNELNVKIPHQYDEIFHVDHRRIPGVGLVPAFLTKGNDKINARDRSGKLNDIEEPNWANIIKKCSS